MSLILGILAQSAGAAGSASSYESIATVTVGSGGAADVTFSSIPSTYTHLQIRGIGRSTAAQNFAGLRMQVGNSSIDTGSNYSEHVLYGDGSSVAAAGSGNISQMNIGVVSAANDTASSFAGLVLDLLDYANTNKYKTTRSLGSVDLNGSGAVEYHSSGWRSTSAITTVKLFATAGNFAQHSTFALYGIKGV